MKRLLILVLLVVIVIVAAPAYVGREAESAYGVMLERLQQSGARVLENRYDRGIFTSEAESTFAVDLVSETSQEGESKPFTFTLKSDITHGPWTQNPFSDVAAVESRLLIPNQVDNQLIQLEGVETRIGFDGAGVTELDIQPLALPLREGSAAVSFSGVKGTVVFEQAGEKLDLVLRLNDLQLTEAGEERIHLDGLELHSNTTPVVSGLRLGSGGISLESLQFKPVESGLIRIQGLVIDVLSRELATGVEAGSTYRLKQVTVGDQRFGPGTLELKIENLPAKVLLEIQQTLQQIEQDNIPDAQQQMAMMGLLFGSGPAVLENDPRLTMNRLYLETPEGSIEGALHLQSSGLQWGELAKPAEALKKVKADGFLELPVSYLRAMVKRQSAQRLQAMGQDGDDQSLEQQAEVSARQQIQRLLEKGYLIERGGKYRSELELVDGRLLVNGNAIPLPF